MRVVEELGGVDGVMGFSQVSGLGTGVEFEFAHVTCKM